MLGGGGGGMSCCVAAPGSCCCVGWTGVQPPTATGSGCPKINDPPYARPPQLPPFPLQERVGRGEFNAATTRVLHFKHNPEATMAGEAREAREREQALSTRECRMMPKTLADGRRISGASSEMRERAPRDRP